MCGATNYPLSIGGPGICPSCDCGISPETSKARMRVAELEIENAALRNDVEMLQQYHIAGRDMNDSVERFIENHDRLGDGHEVIKSRIEQMRNDLYKWKDATSYVQQHGRKIPNGNIINFCERR